MSRDKHPNFPGPDIRTSALSPEALQARAEALLRERRYQEAIPAFRDLLKESPGFADGWYNLAYMLQVGGQFAESAACYERAIELGISRPEEAWRNLALILAEHLAKPAQAETALRRALQCNARFVDAWVDLGKVAEQLGRRNDARAAYEGALAVDPSHATALSHLANVSKIEDADDPLLARLRQAAGETTRPAADLASLGFALGKSLDEAGAYDEAFLAYSRANMASRASGGAAWTGYDRSAWENWTRGMADWFRDGSVSNPAATAEPQLVFVCGMFRSGSTLVETILSSHPHVTAAGELDLIPRIARDVWARAGAGQTPQDKQRLSDAREYYLRTVRTLYPGARVVTDKRPDNFLHVGLIRQLFPTAKIVHTLRDPLDTCLSVFFTHFDLSQTYATDLLDIAHWYKLYEELMSKWKAQYGPDILDVSYEALIADPQLQIARLLDFIGLDWNDACMNFHEAQRSVQTPSVWQVRRPLYSSSCGRWRNYEARIAPLIDALGRRDGRQQSS